MTTASILPMLLAGVMLTLPLAALPAQQPQAQGKPATIEAAPRFQGTTRLGPRGSPDSVRVDVRLWSISGGQKIDQLDLAFNGDMVVELRGGRLTTVINGRRMDRREGEIWLVPAGTRMGVETADDVATLQTWILARVPTAP